MLVRWDSGQRALESTDSLHPYTYCDAHSRSGDILLRLMLLVVVMNLELPGHLSLARRCYQAQPASVQAYPQIGQTRRGQLGTPGHRRVENNGSVGTCDEAMRVWLIW
jgi:hypothetical protein